MSCIDPQRELTGGLSVWLKSAIKEFCLNSPDNSLKNKENDRAWGEPLVGFSSGCDPLYQTIKEDIGPFYMTPIEVFRKSFPDTKTSAGRLTVISWILPQAKVTRADNRKETAYPSERWARSKAHGEVFNAMLRRHVVDILRNAGFEAIAPLLAPFWSWGVSERRGIGFQLVRAARRLCFRIGRLSGSATVSSHRLAKPCAAAPSSPKSPSSRPPGHIPITTNIAFTSHTAHVGNA